MFCCSKSIYHSWWNLGIIWLSTSTLWQKSLNDFVYDCHSWQTLLPLQFIFMGAGMASAPDVPFRSLMLGLKMTLTKSKQTVQTLNAVFSPCFQTIVFSVELHNFIRVPIWFFKTVYQHWSPYKMKCPRTQLDHRGSPLEVHSWTLPPCHCANIQNLWKKLLKTWIPSHFNGFL